MNKSQYFSRTAVYTESNGQVGLADIDNPTKVSPLEPWFGVIYQLADGRHTLAELVQCMTNRYPVNPPAELEKTLDSVVERLTDGKLLILSDEPAELAYYLSHPIEYLDIEKAKQQMDRPSH
ncbi:MAG: hypothetical protein ACJA0N_001886 [Pseudohongiellaceae bacterium]